MSDMIKLEDVLGIIEETLEKYRGRRDKITSLTEHVHQQSAVDALLLVKKQTEISKQITKLI